MNKADRDLRDIVLSAAVRKHPLWHVDETNMEITPLAGAPSEDELIKWFEAAFPEEFRSAGRLARRPPALRREWRQRGSGLCLAQPDS
jgi:hypothetical protein